MKQLGIVKGVAFGLRDCGRPVLSFSVNHYPCTGSLQIVEIDDIGDFLTHDADGKPIYITNISELEGHPVIVESDGAGLAGGRSTLVGLWKP